MGSPVHSLDGQELSGSAHFFAVDAGGLSLALQTAAVYGDLVETAFDVHRFALYDALGWEGPRDSDEERIKGKQLSEFLWRGTLKEKIQYAESARKRE